MPREIAEPGPESGSTTLYSVRTVEHCPIPMEDGRVLSARLWLPRADEVFPSILEAIPYRKGDLTRARDEPMHAYLAARGYVSVRLDLAGSGDSTGVLADEYAAEEQEDIVAAIAWLSEQTWCDGRVGMIGKSWGGFNALQVAAHRPPALGAIVSVCSTDDRFGDDVHFMGGCLLVDGIDWGSALQAYLPLPPDPAVLGDGWRAVWEERLANLTFPLETWLSHLRRDSYWKHGSICEDYGRVEVPSLLVGGWVDGYRTALLRMTARLPGPVKCIMGPWAHMYPHDAVPGPKIGFLQEVVRWFDHWLKGVANEVAAAPKLRAFVQDSETPRTHYTVRAGRWIGEPEWPSPSIAAATWHLTDDGLVEAPGRLTECAVPYQLAIGQFGGDWGGTAMPYELPPDQRYDDCLSLSFDSTALSAPLEILGEGSMRLRVRSDKPTAMLALRLNDMHPDGAVSKVMTGLLNLTYRHDPEHPEPLVPGEWYEVVIRLGANGYRFPAGHRLRLALSPSYWPVAWPSPERVHLEISAPCSIELPLRTAPQEHDVVFDERETSEDLTIEALGPETPFVRQTSFDLAANTVTRRLEGAGAYGLDGLNHIPSTGLTMGLRMTREQTIDLEDPTSASAVFEQRRVLRRPGWDVCVHTTVEMSSTATDFVLHCHVDVSENGHEVLRRDVDRRLPRGTM